MAQRETMFSEGLLSKASPSKHYKKKSINDISRSTGIDFKKGQEFSFTRERQGNDQLRNPITGSNVNFEPYRRCQQPGPQFKGQSMEVNPTGILESKKHIVKNDNIKANRIVSLDLSSIKYKDTEKQGRISGYMNSSQMKGLMSVDGDRYYRGLAGRK